MSSSYGSRSTRAGPGKSSSKDGPSVRSFLGVIAVFRKGFSGLYNVLFTALPPLAMGLFDKSCSAEKMISYPQLYKPSQSGELFNIKVFWMWIINSLVHSALLFWLPVLATQHDVLWINGKEGGYLVIGNAVYTVRRLCVIFAL